MVNCGIEQVLFCKIYKLPFKEESGDKAKDPKVNYIEAKTNKRNKQQQTNKLLYTVIFERSGVPIGYPAR